MAEDVIKLLLAGADITHVCSALLKHGPEHLTTMLEETQHWLEENEYESIRQLKGSVSLIHAEDPTAFERTNYMEVLNSWVPRH